MRPHLYYTSVTILLASIFTILSFNYFDRYEITGPELIQNSQFSAPLDAWEYSSLGVSISDGGIISIYSNDHSKIHHLSQYIPSADQFQQLFLSCEIMTSGITQGPESWSTARIVLFPIDQEGAPLYYIPHTLASLRGNNAWSKHEAIFPVYENVSQLRLSIQLAQATGTMLVRNISLKPITEKPSFITFKYLALLLWLIIITWALSIFIRLAQRNTINKMSIIIGLIITIGILVPGNIKDDISGFLVLSPIDQTKTFDDFSKFLISPIIPSPDIQNAGHLVLFALLAFTVFHRNAYTASRMLLLFNLVLFALVTEVLQLFIDGRTARLSDLLIDYAGIFAGITLVKTAKFISLRE